MNTFTSKVKKLWEKFLTVLGLKKTNKLDTTTKTEEAPYKLEPIAKELKEKNTLVIDEKTTPKLEVPTEKKLDLNNLTIEELRKMAGDHNILVKDSDSKNYIIGLINKHVKEHHK
jgi:hypothetical protein